MVETAATLVTLASEYKPFPKQLTFHLSNSRFKVVAAGNRGGKTVSGAVEFILRVLYDSVTKKGKKVAGAGSARAPRLYYWVVSATYKLLKFSYDEIVRYLPRDLISSINQSDRTLWLKGDIKIEFVSADNPQHLVGASLNGIWVDEACLVHGSAWEGNLRARIADQRGWALFTSTPEGGRANWLYQQLVARSGRDGIEAFSWTTEENEHIPRDEVEHARAITAPKIFARKWCASWDSFGGAIYEEFNDAVHVVTPDRIRFELAVGNRPWRDCFSRIIGAIDFGTASPGCLLVIGEVGDGATWVVLDEFYSVGIRALVGSKHTWYGECQRVMKDFGVSEFFVDAGNDNGIACLSDLRNNGIPAQSAHKNVPKGIERVASAIHVNPRTNRPKLRILPNCVNLAREFKTYQYKPAPNGTDFFEEPAPNQSDHALDALRYGCMALRVYDYVEQQRTASYSRPLG